MVEWLELLVEVGEHFAVQKPTSSILGSLVLELHFRTLIFQFAHGFQRLNLFPLRDQVLKIIETIIVAM